MDGIEIADVVKQFEGGMRALDGVTLTVEEGELLVLVGPSGCGKSTLLRLIAGLERPSAGTIAIGGRDVTDLEPRDRDVAMVFQSYALYPHLTVRENLAFGMRARREPKARIAAQVAQVAETLDLGPLLERKPEALSGGQRQRVAIGRAIVREPAAFLMDEPLSNLDAKLRVAMRVELARLHERLGVTTVYVTHDQVEAMTLGRRVAVLRDGVLQQVGTPEELFARPANAFVATFIGSPSMNLLSGEWRDGTLTVADTTAQLPAVLAERLGRAGRSVAVGVRPTDLHLRAAAGDDPARMLRFASRAEVVERLGTETVVAFRVGVAPIATAGVDARDDARLLAGDERLRMTAVLPGRARVEAHEPVELVAAASDLYLFDPASGRAL